MQHKPDRVILQFEDKKHADAVLSKKKFTIAGREVTALPYTDLTTRASNTYTHGQSIITASDDIVIKVSGITPDMSEEMLLLFFEHQRKSGGGEIKEMEVDSEKGEALLSYVDNKVAERVLLRETFNFYKAQMSVSRVERPKWAKKTVLVTGFGTMTEETLELLYEHKKKSGGGPIESVTMLEENTAALVTFIDEADAARVLLQRFVKRVDGSVISACKPTEMSTEARASGGAKGTKPEPPPSVLSTSVMVLGIDETVTKETLVMLFENESKSGGGPVEKITIDQEFGMAIVTFFKPKVAERVLAKGSIKLLNLNLILHPHIPKTAFLPEGAEAGTDIIEEKAQSGYTLGASANVEEKLQRQDQILRETVNNLKAYEIQFLLAHNFPQNAKQTFQDMTIEAGLKKKNVVFTGVFSDIITAKLQMYELLSQMRYEKLTFSRLVCTLLRQKKTKKYLVNQLQASEAIIVWDVSDSEVMIYGKTPEELTLGVAVIKSCIVEHILDVPDENKPCFRQLYWSQLKEAMLKDNAGELMINVAADTSSITVAASHQIINSVLEQIKTYMTDNTILEKFVNMERGTALLLQREKSPDLRKIEEDFKEFSVKLCPSGIHGKPGYIIEGTKDGLTRVLMRITALAGTVIACDHKINKPGMRHLFLNANHGGGLVTSLESRYRVAIVIGDEEEQPVQSNPTPHKDTAKKSFIKGLAHQADERSNYNTAPVHLRQSCIPVDISILQFHIYGFARESIDQVTQQIEKICKDDTQDIVLDSKADQEVIRKLTEKQTRKIISFEKSHYVKITIDTGKRLARLRIQGLHANVLQVMDSIYRIFRETEQFSGTGQI